MQDSFRVGDRVLNPNGMEGTVTEVYVQNGKAKIKAMFKMGTLPCPITCDYEPEQLRKIVN